MTIGGMVGAVISGKLADIIGRKYGAWLLDLGRLSLGFGYGLTCYVAPTYLSEITPKNLRGGITSVSMVKLSLNYNMLASMCTFSLCGSLLSVTQAMIPVSVSVAYLIGSVINWRALALIGCFFHLLLYYISTELFHVYYYFLIFPINIKGSAGSICNAVSWFCTWLVSFTFNFLVEWSPAGDASLSLIFLILY
ncbi:sugar transporter erd6-like 16 [Quercus suber]|uniref:Sugar transporter erd6-like 16 n=1 Tax=Quercus suber TaxID=58331 RepID=A0AAW0JY58_QUESU